MSEQDVKIIDNYVEQGGKILATGFVSTKNETGDPYNKIRLNALGVKTNYETFEKEQGTYFRIFPRDKERLSTYQLSKLDLVYAWEQGMLCELQKGAQGFLGFIPPAMIGPPEKCYYTEVTETPGLVLNFNGFGRSVFFPWRIGTIYHHKRHYGHAALVMSAIKDMLEYEQDIRTNASPLIEISRQKDPERNFEWYGLLNHTGQLGNGFFDPIPFKDVAFKVKLANQIKSVKSLQTNEAITFSHGNDGWIEIVLPELNTYDIVLLEYK
jgi:hypothetical protein